MAKKTIAAVRLKELAIKKGSSKLSLTNTLAFHMTFNHPIDESSNHNKTVGGKKTNKN